MSKRTAKQQSFYAWMRHMRSLRKPPVRSRAFNIAYHAQLLAANKPPIWECPLSVERAWANYAISTDFGQSGTLGAYRMWDHRTSPPTEITRPKVKGPRTDSSP